MSSLCGSSGTLRQLYIIDFVFPTSLIIWGFGEWNCDKLFERSIIMSVISMIIIIVIQVMEKMRPNFPNISDIQ
jgi:hypothetical protein